jgi:PBSX family phage terminase large subunit
MPLSQAQTTIANDKTRFRVAICGRRFGKTHLAIRELSYFARIPDQEVWYVAPSYKQAKQIVWRKLKNKLQDLKWVQKINESELTIVLKNNSTISLKGADNPDSLRGVGLDFLVMDEFADISSDAWYEVLRPTLADKQGHALFIGTPKGTSNWSYDLYTKHEIGWSSYQYTTIDGGNVAVEEIEAARRDLDERTFRQEFLATFETYANRIFYSFDRKVNVKPYSGDLPSVVYIGMDFNIDPMSAVIFVRNGDILHAIDDIEIYSSNTNEMVEEINSRYPKSRIWVFPDPACRQRKTSAGGSTDLTILQNAGYTVKAPNAHNPVRDGINAVNSKLCNALGEATLFIDPKCKKTIECLDKLTYKEGTVQPDKSSGYDHMSDAFRYAVDYMFPVRKNIDDTTQPTRWGHSIG